MKNLRISQPPLRWAVLLGLLGLVWVLTPHPVPLYDGIGFPDEPYRFQPARSGAKPATSAQLTLKVAGGVNSGGLIANSAEVGPQVSFYAPPKAFAAPGTALISLVVRPVTAVAPLPQGRLDSNVYAVSFTSSAGPVTLVAAAQAPAITMRAAGSGKPAPVFEYRPDQGSPWHEVKTRQVGSDIFNAYAPGAGEYVLVQVAGGAAADGGGGSLYLILGAAAGLVVLVLVVVRVLSRRQTVE